MPSFTNLPGLPTPIRGTDRVALERGGSLFELSVDDFLKALGGGSQVITTSQDKFRDAHKSLNLDEWSYSLNAHDVVTFDGTSHGASFQRLSLSVDSAGTRSTIRGARKFKPPFRTLTGISMSQRLTGELAILRMSGVDVNGDVILAAGDTASVLKSPKAVKSISVSSNVATVTFSTPHGLQPGSYVSLTGCRDDRCNTFAQISGIIDRYAVSCSIVTGNGTHTLVGMQAVPVDFSGGANNCIGLAFLGSDSSLVVPFSRADGGPTFNGSAFSALSSFTAASGPSAQPYCVSLQPRGLAYLVLQADVAYFGATVTDGGNVTNLLKRTQALPSPALEYCQEIEAIRLPNVATPIPVQSIQKTGGTTATLTFAQPHGLFSGTVGRLYGFNTSDFPNVATEAAVTVVDSHNIQMVVGSAATASLMDTPGAVFVPSRGPSSVVGLVNSGMRGYAWHEGTLFLSVNNAPAIEHGAVIEVLNCAALAGMRLKVLANQPVVSLGGSCSTTNGSTQVIFENAGAIGVGSVLNVPGAVNSTLVIAVSGNTVTIQVAATATVVSSLATINGYACEPLVDPAPADSKTAAMTFGAIAIATDVRLHHTTVMDYTRVLTEITGGSLVTNQENTAVATRSVGNVSVAEASILTSSNTTRVTDATTNAINIKSSSGTLFNVTISNPTAAPITVKLYNKASAPTVGTDVPLFFLTVNAGNTESKNFGRLGKRFGSGISLAVTANQATSDTTAVGAGALINVDFV